MSTVITDIFASIKSQVSTTLGGTFTELRRVFDPEKNDFQSVNKSYGLIRLDAPSSESVVRSITFDHSYQVLLADRIIDKGDDSVKQSAIDGLYDSGSDILKALINTKAGVASNVLLVSSGSYSQPEFFDDNQIVLLRVGFIVKFRESL